MRAQSLLAKIVLFILFGLLIFSFAIWGIGDIFRGGAQIRAVAEVDGEPIEITEFSRAFSRELNQVSRQFGTQISSDQAVSLGLDRRVLQSLVSRALFERQAADLGLVVTPDQERIEILREPAFQDEFGNFAAQRFTQALRNAGLSEGAYRQELQHTLLRNQIVNAVINSVEGPAGLARTMFDHQRETRRADYFVVPYQDLAEIADPDESTLSSYYNDNKSSFMAQEARAITLVYLKPEDFVGEVSVTEEELGDYFESRRGELTVAERRNLDQLVFASENDAKAAAALLEGGASLAEAAEQIDGASHVNLGLMARDDLLPALAEAAFALEQGGVSPPVSSPVGWHILQAIAIQPGEDPNFDALSEQLRKDLALDKAVDSIITYVNSLNDELGSGASLEGAATALGLNPQSIPSVNRQGLNGQGEAIEDLPPLPNFTQTLFDTPEGETSLVTETPDGGYYILRVDQTIAPEPRPLEEVRNEVIQNWKQSQQIEQANEQSADLLSRLENGETMEDVASDAGLILEATEPLLRQANSPGLLPARALPDRLFSAKEGEAFSVSGSNGLVIASLKEVIGAEDNEEELNAIQDGLGQSMRADVLDLYLQALEKDYGVVIFENRVNEVLSAY